MRSKFGTLLVVAIHSVLAGPSLAEDWSMFRGPNGTGLSSSLELPDDFSMSNLIWKLELERGGSSTVSHGERVFLTTHNENSRSLKCFDAKKGKELWSHDITKLRKETATPPSDPATCTAVCDGKWVCAFFPDAGIIVTDLDGKLKWQKDLGPFYSMHGISASPVIVDGKLIITVDQLQNPFIAALDIESGNEIWKTERLIGITGGYSTPVHMDCEGLHLLISAGPGEIAGYDLATGEKRVSCTGVTNAPVGIPVVINNRIYFCEPPGEPIPMAALGPVDKNMDGFIELEEVKSSVGTYRLIERIDNGFGNGDGKVDQSEWDKGFGTFLNSGGLSCIELNSQNGEVSSQIVWKYTKSTPYIPSVVIAANRVFMINDGGILSSFDVQSGDMVKRLRLGEATGQYYASPISDGSRLVLANLDGKLSLVKANDDLNPLTTIDLEERIVATPSIHGGRLFVRTESHLYCFGAKSTPD